MNYKYFISCAASTEVQKALPPEPYGEDRAAMTTNTKAAAKDPYTTASPFNSSESAKSCSNDE